MPSLKRKSRKNRISKIKKGGAINSFSQNSPKKDPITPNDTSSVKLSSPDKTASDYEKIPFGSPSEQVSQNDSMSKVPSMNQDIFGTESYPRTSDKGFVSSSPPNSTTSLQGDNDSFGIGSTSSVIDSTPSVTDSQSSTGIDSTSPPVTSSSGSVSSTGSNSSSLTSTEKKDKCKADCEAKCDAEASAQGGISSYIPGFLKPVTGFFGIKGGKKIDSRNKKKKKYSNKKKAKQGKNGSTQNKTRKQKA